MFKTKAIHDAEIRDSDNAWLVLGGVTFNIGMCVVCAVLYFDL